MIPAVRVSSRTSLVSLIVFYLIFTIISSIFFWFLISDIASGSAGKFKSGVIGSVFIIIVAAVILFSIISIGMILVRMFRLKKIDHFQGGLKLRLIAYFSYFALLVTIPQVVLAFMVVNVSAQKWLPANTQSVIMKSRDSLIKTRNLKIQNIEQFSNSRIFNEKLGEMFDNPKQANKIWSDLVETNKLLSSVQIFSKEGETLLFAGSPISKMNYRKVVEQTQEGQLPHETAKNYSFFRYLVPYLCADERQCKVVISQIQAGTENNLINNLTALSRHYQPLIESRVWMKNNIFFVLLLFILVINLISIYISLYLSNQILLPIMDIEQATKKVAEGNFSVRLYPDKRNNFGMLAGAFNKMVFDLEKLQKNSTHSNKMKAWQDIARRMAHEINNPLTPIRLSAERLLRVYKKNPKNFQAILDKSVNAIILEVENLEELLHEFRAFSRLPQPVVERVMLYDLIQEVVEIYRHLGDNPVNISMDNVDRAMILAVDKKQVKQIFSNLIKNSIESLDQGGRIAISTQKVSRRKRPFCRIILEDNGSGIPTEILENIFTPYFTTKKQGTGLGLSIVERIVFAHKGKIRATSKIAQGTSFIIDLPMENNNE